MKRLNRINERVATLVDTTVMHNVVSRVSIDLRVVIGKLVWYYVVRLPSRIHRYHNYKANTSQMKISTI
jgi:hypothetical protein